MEQRSKLDTPRTHHPRCHPHNDSSEVPMQLIYAKAVTFDELPYIEAAFFTVSEVKSHYRETFPYIRNLNTMLADCGRPGVVCGKYECLE